MLALGPDPVTSQKGIPMTSFRLSLVSSILAAALSLGHSGEDRVTVDAQGRIVPVPIPLPAGFANPWPAEYEDAFRTRADAAIRAYAKKHPGGTADEREKNTYPVNCMSFLAAGATSDPAGDAERKASIAMLCAPDGEAGQNAETKGVDFYYGFTIKGQMRKYFFFGQHLDPAHLALMKTGAAALVATDPRPNLELVLLLDCPDEQVRAYAAETLAKIWRSPAQLSEMADAAEREGQTNKKAFAKYLRDKVIPVLAPEPPKDLAAWRTWYALLAAGDWLVFEEYDRRTNQRPHPTHGIGAGPVGESWGPGTRGGVIEWRCTDNLRGMRETTVYLLAEETGNELVRRIAKERLRVTARNFFSIGMGEWDSPAYLAHTITAYVNLHDFAKDPEVRGFAKAILDYLTATGALKYRRGASAAPAARDYGTTTGLCGGPAEVGYLFAGSPVPLPHPDRDLVHFVTSAYRPPAATVALMKKEFPEPVEILVSHPTYSTWLPGAADQPLYHETTFIAKTYQAGSLVEGSGYDVAGCKILVDHATRGCDLIIPSTQEKGSLVLNRSKDDRIAQHRNLLLFLKRTDKGQWNIQVPSDATVEVIDGKALVKCERTWLAFLPVNGAFKGLDPARHKNFSGKTGAPAGTALLSGDVSAGPVSGFAIEIGEAETHGDFDAFKAKVLANAKVDLSALAESKVGVSAASGASVALQFSDEKTVRVWRAGKEHDLSAHRALFRSPAGKGGPLDLGWKEGVLTIEAGGHKFTGTLDLKTGAYRSESVLKP